MRLVRVDDLEDARDLWAEWCKDLWPGDDHTFWRLTDGDTDYGMCSAVYRPEKGYVYLSYGSVDPAFAGAGLQRRLIRHRLRWGRRQGALYAVTYTVRDNYPSMANLLKCGFRFAARPRGWRGVEGDVHYFEREL